MSSANWFHFSSSVKTALKILLIIACLGVINHREFAEHRRNVQDFYVFNDDVRQYIPPFYQYQNDGPSSEDYITNYYLQAVSPIGFRALYQLAARFWDPIAVSKVLPYLLWVSLLVTVGITSWKLGGATTCFATLALTLFSVVFFGRMVGALPRSFGFPLLALALAAVVFGRVYWTGIMTVLGAAFYPLVTVITGMTMALVLLVLPSKYRGEAAAWSYKKSVAVLLLTAALSGATALPQLQNGASYGRRVLASDVESFPEAGLDGRYDPGDAPPFDHVGIEVIRAVLSQYGVSVFGLRPGEVPANASVQILSAIGLLALLIMILVGFNKQAPEAVTFRLLMMVLATGIAHAGALILLPYLYIPSRYVTYTAPLFFVIIVPVGLYGMAASLSTLKEKASLLTVTLVALFVIVFAGQRGVGYTVRVASHRPLYSFIATLPPDSVIAGWPLGIMDNVPYLGRRNAFLTYETHQVLHMEYMQEMRKRMTALIDAYLGQDIQPLLDLNKRFGVDYLLVDKRHFAKGSSLNPPWYFAPFREQILSLVAQTQGNAFVMSNRVDPAAIFWGGDILLLDLSLLDQ